jgi:hypothetical protein
MTMRSLRDLISDAITAGKALCATILRFEPFTAVSLAVQSTGSPWGRVRLTANNISTGGFIMSRRVIVSMLGLGLALFMMPQHSLAAEDHVAEAITHTEQALEQGRMGKAKELTVHAEAALRHAEAGENAKANPHLEKAIKHLEQALAEGRNEHAEAATTHAEGALRELEQAK